MKGSKKIWALFVMIAMLASLTACGSKDDEGTKPTMATEPTEEAPEPTTATDAPEPTDEASATEAYTVTLPDGTELTFDGVPKRIVSMGPNITEILYAIGAGDKLVGRTTYSDYPEEALVIESVGSIYSPDIEKILELQPDVVIGSIHFAEETEEQLKGLGIQVAVLYDSTSMEGVYDIIRTVGQIAGYAEEAEALAATTQEKINAVIAAVSQEESKPTVYYVVGYGEYGDYTASGDTFIGQMLAAAGGDNIASGVSGWIYSLETLLDADPDIIIIGLGEAEGFKTAENYNKLSAVLNDMVYEIDRNLLDRQGYRNAEGMEALRDIISEGMQALQGIREE